MASLSPSKIKELKLSPEFISEFGIVKAILVNGYITFRHKSGGTIRCEYDGRSLPKLERKLQKATVANEDRIKFESDFDSRKFIIRVIELLVEDAEKEHEKYESVRSQDQNQKQKIRDEISKDKTTLNISLEVQYSL